MPSLDNIDDTLLHDNKIAFYSLHPETEDSWFFQMHDPASSDLLLDDVLAPWVHRTNDCVICELRASRERVSVWLRCRWHLDCWALDICASDLVAVSNAFNSDYFKEQLRNFLLFEFPLLYLRDWVCLQVRILIENLSKWETLKTFQAKAFLKSSVPNFLPFLLNILLLYINFSLKVVSHSRLVFLRDHIFGVGHEVRDYIHTRSCRHRIAYSWLRNFILWKIEFYRALSFLLIVILCFLRVVLNLCRPNFQTWIVWIDIRLIWRSEVDFRLLRPHPSEIKFLLKIVSLYSLLLFKLLLSEILELSVNNLV